MKRLVLFVEGEGEETALPILVKRLLTHLNAWNVVTLDPNPFRIGHLAKVIKDKGKHWQRFLAAALKRKDVGGILTVLDGDIATVQKELFCPAIFAKRLAVLSRNVGGGTTFSIAVVFAMQEFESWLIGGFSSLAGKTLEEHRLISSNAELPKSDLEQSPRDAKAWFNKAIQGGYSPTRDQAKLTELVDIDSIRQQEMRSFQRFESAVKQLVDAISNNQHLVSPTH